MRVAFDRAVVEVDQPRGEEDEQENQRNHHVVLNGPALVRPKNEAFCGAPDLTHRYGRRFRLGGFEFSVQDKSIKSLSHSVIEPIENTKVKWRAFQ